MESLCRLAPKSTTAPRPTRRHSQCEKARLVCPSHYLPASHFQAFLQSANLKKLNGRPSKARILFKLCGRTKMLAWKWVFQNHLSVAHFHLAFRRFQNLVCLPYMARKNAAPVLNLVWVFVLCGFWLNVADRQAWFSVWRFQLVLGAKKSLCFHLESCPASLNHPKLT